MTTAKGKGDVPAAHKILIEVLRKRLLFGAFCVFIACVPHQQVMANDQAAASDLLDFDTTFKLAQQGDRVAQNNLGYSYNYGIGVPEDYVQAKYWYEKSAQQGFVEAQFHLAEL